MQGAVVGFVTAFAYNMWLVVGKFMRGGGSPPRLPLSTSGCLEDVVMHANTTILAFLTNTTVTHDLTLNASSTVKSGSKTLYDTSYCYSGVTGILITLVVSSAVSLATGG
ncbi:sodium-coupled monocarboxylate transporter 1-like [Procambarus clarkii]|uniref:sodium-coupled monocarboxylate transporter 1-like n=1 Tax=Procambarus clarkii TaxID=6728 RepID=UPI00374289E1